MCRRGRDWRFGESAGKELLIPEQLKCMHDLEARVSFRQVLGVDF